MAYLASKGGLQITSTMPKVLAYRKNAVDVVNIKCFTAMSFSTCRTFEATSKHRRKIMQAS